MESQPGPKPRACTWGELVCLTIPPTLEDAARDRVAVIGDDLTEWLERHVSPDDMRAAAYALLELAVGAHIEVMGERRAFSHLSGILDFWRHHGVRG